MEEPEDSHREEAGSFSQRSWAPSQTSSHKSCHCVRRHTSFLPFVTKGHLAYQTLKTPPWSTHLSLCVPSRGTAPSPTADITN